MLYLIPPPLHRLLYRLAHAIRLRWWRLIPPDDSSVSVIALNGDGHLLLLRQSYGTARWVLPAGGIARGEDAEQAALREFAEEAGCPLREPAFLCLSEEPFHRGRTRMHVFTGRVDGPPRPDGREIVAARFFPLHDLPADIDRRTMDRLVLAGFQNSAS